jgi:transcriptional regulator with XRE-family HTH domain
MKKRNIYNIQNMDLTYVFVQNLKKWRKNMGFSQKTLAERCNAAHSYIRQIESGTGHPSFAFIEKLANALNIEPYRLFYDETAENPNKSNQSKHIEVLKAEFLERVENEFDTIINKLIK